MSQISIRNVIYFLKQKFNAEPHPKTSHVSGTSGEGAEGRKHGHHLKDNVAEKFTYLHLRANEKYYE